MGGFFNMDGPFYKYGTLLADIMILTLMWILFSLPIFTMGAATTALYYVTTKRANNKDGYVMRDFWRSFKLNFKRATFMWLIVLVLIFIATLNIMNIGVMGKAASIFLPLEIVLILEVIIICLYLFPMISRFEMGKLQLIKSAFILANRHLLTTLMCLVLGAGMLLALSQWPFLFVLGMGTYAYLSSMLLVKIFKKYRPEMDRNETYDDIIESQNAQRAIEGLRREHLEERAATEAAMQKKEQENNSQETTDYTINETKDDKLN